MNLGVIIDILEKSILANEAAKREERARPQRRKTSRMYGRGDMEMVGARERLRWGQMIRCGDS